MRLCVFHTRLGTELGRALAARLPDAQVEVVTDTDRDPDSLGEIEALVANTFPQGMLGRCPRLRWLQLTGTGTEHLAAGDPAPGLLVSHAGEIPARAVAEFVWMGLLALAKDAPSLVRRQDAHLWQLPEAKLVAGTTLVLVGLGNIGREVARRARAFDVRVIAVTRTGAHSPLVDEVLPASRLVDAVALADHLVIAVPGTPQTRNLVNETVIRAIPRRAVLINIARASVLSVDALVGALREGRLSGALLDVHEPEPLPADSPLWDVDRLWVTPHGAFCYPGEAQDLAALVVENAGRLAVGTRLRNQVERS